MEIIFYAKRNGIEPAREFIESLDTKMKIKIERAVAALAKDGSRLAMPFSKYLKDGIYELRAQIGSNSARVLYFFVVGNYAVLTNGFIKKTQKTPTSEINKAKKYQNDFLNRNFNKQEKK